MGMQVHLTAPPRFRGDAQAQKCGNLDGIRIVGVFCTSIHLSSCRLAQDLVFCKCTLRLSNVGAPPLPDGLELKTRLLLSPGAFLFGAILHSQTFPHWYPIGGEVPQMLSLLITLLIVCLIASVAWWIISVIPFPPPLAFARIILQIIVAVILLIWLVSVLLPYAGGGFGHPLLR